MKQGEINSKAKGKRKVFLVVVEGYAQRVCSPHGTQVICTTQAQVASILLPLLPFKALWDPCQNFKANTDSDVPNTTSDIVVKIIQGLTQQFAP